MHGSNRSRGRGRAGKALGTFVAVSAMLALPASAAQAYNPTGGTLYQLGSEPCLKRRGNCAVYPKSAQLPSGRLVASPRTAPCTSPPRPSPGPVSVRDAPG